MMVFEAKFDIRRKIKKRVEVQFEKDIKFLISNCSLKLHENCWPFEDYIKSIR